jgi:SRSO17 transposase
MTDIKAYDLVMLTELALENISEHEINEELEHYLRKYSFCFVRSQQKKYFEAFEKGVLSGLDRKSIEPIALHFLGEGQVRGMQQFFKRSRGWEESVEQRYQHLLSEQISCDEGFVSVDESCFVKKGAESAGVARQYCGRLGKKENCQSGVFLSYASEKGYGLVSGQLYLPQAWFGDSYSDRRDTCQIPKEAQFQTKNEIASQMLGKMIESDHFPSKWIGFDAAFGSDHGFLDGLPDTVHYFAAVKEKEYIFRSMPDVAVPESPSGRGGRFKHPRACVDPVHIKSIAEDDSIPWETRAIAEGAKGPAIADIKCTRCVSSRKINRLFMPGAEIWVYIRRYEDGTIKYFVSNAPTDTSQATLDKLATMRWSIEQCFQECKSYLGMAHYETRSYQAWHRHMLMVMIAHLFTTVLRCAIKKQYYPDYAYGSVSHRGNA